MAYLLDRTNLGGLGNAIAVHPAARGAIITAATAYPLGNAVLVAFQARGALCPNGAYVSGIGALAVTAEVNIGSMPPWCARLDGGGVPIVTTTNGSSAPIVWAVGAEGDDRLHAFRGDTGEETYTGGGAGDRMTGLRHFATILVAAGRFYIAAPGGSSLSNCRNDVARALHRHGRRESRGCSGDGPRGRRSGGRRSGSSRPDPTTDPAAIASAGTARAAANRRMADPGRTHAHLVEAALKRLRSTGVALRTLEDCPQLAAVEAVTADAPQITMGINGWEWRWPPGSFVARDASVLPERAGAARAQCRFDGRFELPTTPLPLHRMCQGQAPA